MEALNVVELPLTDITPYWRNPRVHDKTIPALVKSIERYGFNVPLLVDEDHVIVAGHARFKAVQALGFTKVPCVVVTHLSPKEIQELRLLDNRVQEFSTWDRKKLITSLQDIVSGSDVADFFAGSLDRAVKLNLFADDAVATAGLAEAISGDVFEEDVNRCPFCNTPLTVADILEGAPSA